MKNLCVTDISYSDVVHLSSKLDIDRELYGEIKTGLLEVHQQSEMLVSFMLTVNWTCPESVFYNRQKLYSELLRSEYKNLTLVKMQRAIMEGKIT